MSIVALTKVPECRACDLIVGCTPTIMAILSTIMASLGLGLVGLAAGTTMFLLAPSGKKGDAPKKAGAELQIGAGYVGVAGQF